MIARCFPKLFLNFCRCSLMCCRCSLYEVSWMFINFRVVSLNCHWFLTFSTKFRRLSSIRQIIPLTSRKFHYFLWFPKLFFENSCIIVDPCLNSIVFQDFLQMSMDVGRCAIGLLAFSIDFRDLEQIFKNALYFRFTNSLMFDNFRWFFLDFPRISMSGRPLIHWNHPDFLSSALFRRWVRRP